jgi:hypothetical protein
VPGRSMLSNVVDVDEMMMHSALKGAEERLGSSTSRRVPKCGPRFPPPYLGSGRSSGLVAPFCGCAIPTQSLQTRGRQWAAQRLRGQGGDPSRMSPLSYLIRGGHGHPLEAYQAPPAHPNYTGIRR